MGNFINKVTDAIGLTDYGGQQDAIKDASGQQLAASREQIDYLKAKDAAASEKLQPYENFGRFMMPGLARTLTPEGQMSYLRNNPLFNAAVNSANAKSAAMGAAAGKTNSGGMVNELFNNYLSQGEGFINNQFNRLNSMVNMGQNSAAGQANNSLQVANQVAGVMGNQGDIRSAGIMAGSNANQQALQGGMNMLGGGLLGSGLIGGAGLAGGGAGGAALGALMFSDERLKENIKLVYRDDLGGVYEFNYIGDEVKYVGRLAQELQLTRPDAVVVGDDGYLRVTPEFAPRAI